MRKKIVLALAALVIGTGIYSKLEAKTPYKTIIQQEKPTKENFNSLVSYVQKNIGPTGKTKYNGPKIVYFLPDMHISLVHEGHKSTIDQLIKKLGLKHIGREGYMKNEKVNKEYLEKALKATKETQKRGGSLQLQWLDKNPKKIQTIEDLIELYPLLAYAGTEIKTIGLEEPSTANRYIELTWGIIPKILKKYWRYQRRSKRIKIYEEIMQKKTLGKWATEETNRLRKKTKKLKKEIKELIKKYKIPIKTPIDKDLHTKNPPPFEKELTTWIRDQRSINSVRILAEEMEKRKIQQIAVVYGENHRKLILKELTKKGISYIVIK